MNLHLGGGRNARARDVALARRGADDTAVERGKDRVHEVADGADPGEVEEGARGLREAAVLRVREAVVLEVARVAAAARTGEGGNGSGTGEEEDPVEEVDDGHGDREVDGLNNVGKDAEDDAKQEREGGGENRETDAVRAALVVDPRARQTNSRGREDEKKDANNKVTKGSHVSLCRDMKDRSGTRVPGRGSPFLYGG